jgi:hypothetical protein
MKDAPVHTRFINSVTWVQFYHRTPYPAWRACALRLFVSVIEPDSDTGQKHRQALKEGFTAKLLRVEI